MASATEKVALATRQRGDAGTRIYYPRTSQERRQFKTKSGKVLTPHQWAVYDFILTIPKGQVSTYKGVSLAIGGSPRSVGAALRNNPFAPFVPCHRVIASNLFIGGFMGEWEGREGESDSGRCVLKRKLLEDEGVTFDAGGFLKYEKKCLWMPNSS
ncbi:6-O-methylguanine DNA methyltransferase [Cyathus striatus]|nr:6-O-methylguanine DNA methyltransferase [Cyathus striatus]